ncbi:MAG: methyltransferase domain-containing protein [Anaerolineales bacterium]|nr:methyltransferase domain-containing protein [Anaerolineales bacterium]
MTAGIFPREFFARHDESDDRLFYRQARKETYIDEDRITALKRFLHAVLPAGGMYLDLLSGWQSHLPEDLHPYRMIGLGLNADEMSDNPQLDSFVLQDVNKRPVLPFEDSSFDIALCSFSIQYLTRPVELFQEVNRILKPGGRFINAFSERCFPEKTIAIWLVMNTDQKKALVRKYFEASGNWGNIHTEDLASQAAAAGTARPLVAIWASKRRAALAG